MSQTHPMPNLLTATREIDVPSKMKIALGAAGLLMFIVGVKKTYELRSGERSVEVGEREVKLREGGEERSIGGAAAS